MKGAKGEPLTIGDPKGYRGGRLRVRDGARLEEERWAATAKSPQDGRR